MKPLMGSPKTTPLLRKHNKIDFIDTINISLVIGKRFDGVAHQLASIIVNITIIQKEVYDNPKCAQMPRQSQLQ